MPPHDQNAQLLAEMLLRAEGERKMQFPPDHRGDSSFEETTRRDAYLTTVEHWLKNVSVPTDSNTPKPSDAGEERPARVEKAFASISDHLDGAGGPDGRTAAAPGTSEPWLRSAYRAATAGAWEWDLRTNQNTWSEELWAVFGLEPNCCEPSYESWLRLIHPDDRSQVEERVRQAVNAGKEIVVEWRLCDPFGRKRWVMSRGQPIRNSNGALVRYIGMVLDISDRKTIEEELRLTNERFQTSLRSSPVVVFNQDRDLRYTWIYNPALGYSAQECIGKRDCDLFESPDDAAVTHAMKQAVLDSGVSCRREVRIRSGGIDLHYDLLVEPLRDSAGVITGVTCAAVDITPHKRMEQQLNASEERFRLAAAAAHAMVYDFDLQAMRLNSLHGVSELLGMDPPEGGATLEWWGSLVDPEDLPGCQAALERVRSTRTRQTIEYRVRHKDGRQRWVEDKVMALVDATGTPARLVGTVVDITERKLAELALIVAKNSAETANRSKDRFLAVISHELRTPLTPLLLFAEELGNDPLMPPAVRSACEMIQSNALVVGRLIDDLLDISRIENGKLIIKLELCDAHVSLKQVLEMVRGEAQAKRVDLQSDLGAHRSRFLVDALRLQQVFWNLLRNAVKFAPAGSVVSVRTYDLPSGVDAGERFCFEVRDTGVGFEPGMAAQIFEPFEQGGRGQHFGGLGLGLAIARAIVELHGGTIRAASPGLNLGATFTVQLPVQ